VPRPRPCWKGYLKLSFVSCPISLYPATSAAERVSFREVNRRTGHRLKHKLVDSITGEAVDRSEKARGYEVGEDEFLIVEDEDLARARSARPPAGAVPLAAPPQRENGPIISPGPPAFARNGLAVANEEDEEEAMPAVQPIARPENTHTIEIERFLPAGQIDARYFAKPYYIVPRQAIGQEAFAVIRDAMSRAGVVGLGRTVLSSRERPLLLEPMGSGLRGVTLRFAHEVRSEADYFGDIPQMRLPAEMMKLAQHIIRTKSTDFDPSMLEDHYRNALMQIVRTKKAKPRAQPAPVKPSPENVVSLMDALRHSIAAERPARQPPRRSKPAAVKGSSRARRAG
jgi:DNA end-binding protein Ku